MNGFSGKQSFQTVRVIHLALMTGLILFSGVVIYLNSLEPNRSSEMDATIMLAVAGSLTIMAIFVGPILYKQQLSTLKGDETLQQKMAAFQTAHIIRSALLEGAGLFGAVTCIVTWNLLGLAFTAVCIGMFVLKMPTPNMLEQDLKLSSSEKNQLTEE
jgi:hypothetical protein